MKFSCKIIMNKKPNQDGTVLLYLQAFINGQRTKKSIGITVDAKKFDKERGLMRGEEKESTDLNIILRNKIARANSIAAKYRILEEMSGISLTKKTFEKEFFANTTSKGEFLTWYDSRMRYRYTKKIVEFNTYKAERTTLKKLQEYREEIFFAELNKKFMEEFNNWLIRVKNNSQNTRWNHFKHLKCYITEAKREGLYAGDPFEGFQIKQAEGRIVFLEQSEVKALTKYYKSKKITPSHYPVLRAFLFSCFSGLRISDIQTLRGTNIMGNFIVFIPNKTKKKGKFVRVPLSSFAKEYLPKVQEPNDLLFKSFTDQELNRTIKEIAELCGIKKNLSFHIARHTFATLYLELGGQVEVLQGYLGHTKISDTMKYVHVSDKVSAKEIKRFDQLNKKK